MVWSGSKPSNARSAACSPLQNSNCPACKVESLRHHGNHIRKQGVAQSRVLALDALIGVRTEFVNHARALGLDRCATRLPRDEAHLTDRCVWPQTANADRVTARVDHDPDSPVQKEMHGISRIPLAHNNFLRLSLNPFALLNQLVSMLRTGERFSEPLAQGVGLAVPRLVRLDDRVLTQFKGTVEIWRDDIIRNEPPAEDVFHIAWEARQYDPCAALVGELLNLYEVEDRALSLARGLTYLLSRPTLRSIFQRCVARCAMGAMATGSS